MNVSFIKKYVALQSEGLFMDASIKHLKLFFYFFLCHPSSGKINTPDLFFLIHMRMYENLGLPDWQNFGWKNFLVGKILGLKSFWTKKFLGPKNFRSKNIWVKRSLVQKNLVYKI